MLADCGVDIEQATVGDLRTIADHTAFHRFDIFNQNYNIFGHEALRSVFLKTSNAMDGRYFAELMHEVLRSTEGLQQCLLEMRLSIYGRRPGEWDELAHWFLQNKMQSSVNAWMIQIPRVCGPPRG